MIRRLNKCILSVVDRSKTSARWVDEQVIWQINILTRVSAFSQKSRLCSALPWCQDIFGNKFRKLEQSCLISVFIFFLAFSLVLVYCIPSQSRNSNGINVRVFPLTFTRCLQNSRLCYGKRIDFSCTQVSLPWAGFVLLSF